jgi:hypothetical protein
VATGLTVRDFVKTEREVTYSLQGSFLLSEIEKNAYRNSLTVEIVAVDSPRYSNLKTLPENTHWGYLTHFRGSTVTLSQPLKFVRFRAFDIINDGIWQYHQHQESVRLTAAIVREAANQIVSKAGGDGSTGGAVGFVIDALGGVGEFVNNAFAWLVETFVGDQSPEDDPGLNYTAFPIASPFPDIIKFKSDVPVAFKFRLETWYLVDPAVYITSNPTDTGDQTDGEDQYPQPAQGDGDGDGSEFPPSSAPDPNADPRDGRPGSANGSGTWNVPLRFSNGGNNPPCNNVPVTTVQLRGFPDELPQLEYLQPPTSFGGRPGRVFTSIEARPFGGDCLVTINSLPVFNSD